MNSNLSPAGCDHLEFFAEHESQVRAYCRHFPALFKSARGSVITDTEGHTYVDLLSACGALNYGHNHPHLRSAAVEYLLSDGISAGLDFHTEIKLHFMSKFEQKILAPRGLRYRMQFPGPTGTNCVEAAIKLARKATGRPSIVAFTNAFHGVSMGSLAATGSASCRASAQGLLGGEDFLTMDTPGPASTKLPGSRECRRTRQEASIRRSDFGGVRPRRRGTECCVGRMAGRSRCHREASRRPVDRRRDPDGLRSNRTVLQLRARRHRTRYRVPCEIHRWIRASDVVAADATGLRRLVARRAQRNLSREFARFRDGSCRAGSVDGRLREGGGSTLAHTDAVVPIAVRSTSRLPEGKRTRNDAGIGVHQAIGRGSSRAPCGP
ncbi:hypothetical protein ABIB85_007517 [Bradyrhizobium sp. JR1.5]